MGLLYWRPLPDDIKAAVEVFAVANPDAPGVASMEGFMLAVRSEHNRYSRQRWNELLAVDGKLRALCVCPDIHWTGCVEEQEQIREAAEESRKRAVRKQTNWEKVGSFLSAMTGPRVADDVAARRLETCKANVCGHLITKDSKLYCGACGCPKWHLAELSTKVRFATLHCPCDPAMW